MNVNFIFCELSYEFTEKVDANMSILQALENLYTRVPELQNYVITSISCNEKQLDINVNFVGQNINENDIIVINTKNKELIQLQEITPPIPLNPSNYLEIPSSEIQYDISKTSIHVKDDLIMQEQVIDPMIPSSEITFQEQQPFELRFDEMNDNLNLTTDFSTNLTSFHLHKSLEGSYMVSTESLAIYKIIRKNKEIHELAYAKQNKHDLILYDLLSEETSIIKGIHVKGIYKIKHYFYKELNINLLLTLSFDNSVKIWNINQLPIINIFDLQNCHQTTLGDPFAVIFNESKYYLIGGTINEKMNVWDSGKTLVSSISQSKLTDCCFLETFYINDEPNVILSGYPFVEALDYKKNTMKTYRDYYCEASYHLCVNLHKFNEVLYLLEGDSTGFIRIFNYFSTDLCQVINTAGNMIYSLCVYNQRFILSGGEDKLIRIIDLINSQTIMTYNDHNQLICNIFKVIENNEEILISSSYDGIINIWKKK